MKRSLSACFLSFYIYDRMSHRISKTKARLNHIAIYVIDLKISSDFYAQIVGLDTIPEPFHDGRHTWFSVGPKSHLHVISGALKKQNTIKTAISVLAFFLLLILSPCLKKIISHLKTGPVKKTPLPSGWTV